VNTRRIVCGALIITSLLGCQGTQTAQRPEPAAHADAAADVSAGIVRVVPTRDDGLEVSALSGLVTADGHVLTLMGPLGHATGATVVTSTGNSFVSTGVAGYLTSEYVALIEVDWGMGAGGAGGGHAAPRALALADRQAPPGTKVTIARARGGPGGPDRREAVIGDRESTVALDLVGPGLPDPAFAGAPVLDRTRRVIGLVHGFSAGLVVGSETMLTGQILTGALQALPVETLVAAGAAGRGPVMTWDQWRALAPQREEADELAGKARALTRRGKSDEALETAQRAVGLDDRNAAAWLEAGIALEAKGSHEAALGAFDRCLALEPTNLFAGRTKRYCLLELGRLPEAMAESERLAALAPWDSRVMLEHGDMLWRSRRFLEARGAFEETLRLDPKNETARKDLELVNKTLGAR
jgi:hypothetical protein